MNTFRGIRSIFSPPVFEDPEKTHRAQLLNFIAWAAIVVLLILLGMPVIRGISLLNHASFILEGLLIIILVMIYLIHRGHVRMASAILVLVSWSSMVYQAWIADGVRDTAVLGQLTVIIVCSLVLGWRTSAWLTVLSILSEWAMAILELRGVLHPSLDDPFGVARDMTGIFLMAAVLMYLILRNMQRSVDALRASEERFRKFFHSSLVAICICSLEDGRFIEANDTFWKMTGFTSKEALSKTAAELGMWHSNQAEWQGFVQELKARHSIQSLHYQFASASNKKHDTRAFYELIHLDDQLCVLSMFYDITEQKKAQDDLMESEARNRVLLNAIPDMIIEFDKHGVFLDYIQSQELDPIIPPAEFLGRKIQDVMPASIASQAMTGIEQALKSDKTYTFEYQLDGKKGLRDYEARITAKSQDKVIAMIRDITSRKSAEAERESLIKELESKNAELEQFTYTVSHDLKAPLITIKGFLSFLQEDSEKGNAARLEKDVQHIADATDKMQRLLNQLLELSRIGRLMDPPQEIPFEGLAREAVELVQGRLQSNRIEMHIQENVPKIFGDRQRLLEVIQNLVDNAAKFMGDQSKPCIEIGQSGEEAGKPIFFVRDNGIGIASEHHQHIFGLFNKLDPNSEGTGVGLALARRIVEVHGGKMWVESEPGKGSMFFFSIAQKPQS